MDEYDEIRERYNSFFRGLVPRLDEGKVSKALESMNTLVGLVRPSDWTVSQVPSEILGMTPEGVVVYSGAGRLGFYFCLPFDEIWSLVSDQLDKARTDFKGAECRCDLKTAEKNDAFHQRVGYERVQYLESLLNDLEVLRRK